MAVGLFALAAGSSRKEAPARVADAAVVLPPAETPKDGNPKLDTQTVDKKPAAPDEPGADLIVGSKRGLEAWRRDGSAKRMISRGAAPYPRWLDPQTVLVARPAGSDDDFSGGGRLERIALVDGKRTRVAKLPPFACAKSGEADASEKTPMSLGIQDGSDFVVDSGKRFACIELMDRNINMADLAVVMRIDLENGKVQRRLTMGKEQCIAPKGVTVGDAEDEEACTAASDPAAETKPAVFPFNFDNGAVSREGVPNKVLKIDGYDDLLKISPSGRWAVLGGDQEDGDFIHRSVVLLDRSIGQVFPIRDRRQWPAPLRPSSKKKARIEIPIARTASVVGETDVRWLGTAEDSELLVVGDLVVKPGVASFAVKGEIAR